MKYIYYNLIFLFALAFSVNGQNDIKLKFDKNGEFKVVQFTDTHVKMANNSNLNVFEIMKGVINIEKPDFVILTGDIATQNNPQEAYKLFVEVFKETKTPWAVVFGNHESESNLSRKRLADHLQSLPYCMNNDIGDTYGNSNLHP